MVFSQHARLAAKITAFGSFLIAILYTGAAQAEWALNFQRPVTSVARDIFDLHMFIFWVCVAIFVAVFGVMFYSIFKHRKSKNHVASQFSHSTSVEVVWTVIPALILIVFAVPATVVLINMEDTTKSDMTIKITGYQWKWGYEYLDSDISFYSSLTTPREQIDQFDKSNAVEQGENYLLETDNELVVPSGRKVRGLITANDVIHAWWIPAFGVKKDAIPGYINEIWFNVDEGEEGVYRGQCAELCGKDHAFMPIVVRVVTGAEFDAWVAAGGSFDASNLVDSNEAKAPAVTKAASFERAPGDSATKSVIEAIVPAAQAAEEVSNEENEEETESKEAPETAEAQTQNAGTVEKTIKVDSVDKDALIALGETVSVNCNACHGADGKGGAGGMFPAIAGSKVATGPIDEHIKTVMFGKPGTAMAAFAAQLSDEELAAVITYQRNAFGNDTGDVVSPADIEAKRN